MKRMLSLAVVMTAVGTTGPVLAHNSERECLRGSGETAISAATMKKKISGLGYVVGHLKAGASCYDALIIDKDSGGQVKAKFDMANGELVSAEPAK